MEALGQLGINLPGLVAQLINFSLLLAILFVVGYRPIMRMLDERSNRIKDSMDKAEFIKQEAERVKDEVAAKLEEARREGQSLVAQANQIGERLKAEAKQEAQQQGEALIARARSEIQRERDEAVAELRQEFAELTILAAEKVINRTLDEAAHKQLIEEVLEESARLKEN